MSRGNRYDDSHSNNGNGSRYEPDNQHAQRKKGGAGNVISTILLLIAIGIFVFSAYKLIGYYLKYKVGTDEYNRLASQYAQIEVQDEGSDDGNGDEVAENAAEVLTSVEELEKEDTLEEKVAGAAKDVATENGEEKTLPLLVNPIDFDSLTSINEDIVGWIRIGGIEVSYPMVQGEDNDYYLHRTFERVDNFAGSIFLDCYNSRYVTDQNTIVYGHNMKNGSMFGKLKKFREQETYDENPYFWIFTPTLIYQYKIYSAREVVLADPNLDVYDIRFTTEDFQSFLNTAASQNLIDNKQMSVTTDDRIVTLSTCTGSDATRFVVQGKLEQIYIAR